MPTYLSADRLKGKPSKWFALKFWIKINEAMRLSRNMSNQ